MPRDGARLLGSVIPPVDGCRTKTPRIPAGAGTPSILLAECDTVVTAALSAPSIPEETAEVRPSTLAEAGLVAAECGTVTVVTPSAPPIPKEAAEVRPSAFARAWLVAAAAGWT